MKNENNIELISPIGETCNKVDLKKAMVPICDEKLSPFASYVGDMHKLNKPKKNTTKMEADFLLEKGHIGDIEKAILMTINHLLFATLFCCGGARGRRAAGLYARGASFQPLARGKCERGL